MNIQNKKCIPFTLNSNSFPLDTEFDFQSNQMFNEHKTESILKIFVNRIEMENKQNHINCIKVKPKTKSFGIWAYTYTALRAH